MMLNALSKNVPISYGTEIVPQTFKTANGLISFLESLGFTHVTIPIYQGGRATHTLPTPEEPLD